MAMLYQTMCERCGTVTVTPILPDVQVRVYRNPDGADRFVTLCPECKGKWERMLSNFLTVETMTLHDMETGACKCERHGYTVRDDITKAVFCAECGHDPHDSRKYCGALR